MNVGIIASHSTSPDLSLPVNRSFAINDVYTLTKSDQTKKES